MTRERATREPLDKRAFATGGELVAPLANAAGLLATLSDPDVLRVVSWMLDRPAKERAAVTQCAETLGLDGRAAARVYGKLTASGLLGTDGPHLSVRLDLLRAAARHLDEANPVVQRLATVPAVAALFSHGRLTSLPVEPSVCRALAAFLATFFDPERTYDEAAVNGVLRQVHDDFAALRRLLVDEGVMARDRASVYRRAPGASETPTGQPAPANVLPAPGTSR